MRQAYLVGEAARHIKAGRLDKGHDNLIRFLKANDGNGPPEVFAMLADLAKVLPTAAVNLAVSYLIGHAPEPSPGEARRLLEGALGSDDRPTAAQAHYRLALMLMGEYGQQVDMPAAVEHFRKCVELRAVDDLPESTDAAYSLGVIYMTGGEGVEKDSDEAAEWLRMAADDEHPEACLALALMILKGEASGEVGEALDLLEEAAESGNDEAISLLDTFDGRDEDEIAAILRAGKEGQAFEPTRIPPADAKRPRLVADALINELGAPKETAEIVAAHFYGYPTLEEAIAAAGSEEGEPPDEDCDAETVSKRRRQQVRALRTAAQFEQDEAEMIVELLRPTCRLGRPSLASLKERLQNRLFPFSSDEMEAAMGDFLKRHGIDGNFTDIMNAGRTMMPINPEIWLAAMEQHLGWKFTDENPDAERNGSLVAKAVGKGRRKIPVYMSSVGYLPGDNADSVVSDLKKRIQAAESMAVLLFNKPLVWPDKKDKRQRALLYGGQVLKDGRWSDFVLRPGGGVDDAFEQSGMMAPTPSVQFVERFSFETAVSLGVTIAAMQHGYEPDEVDVSLVSVPTGWAQPMVSPAEGRRGRRQR